MVLGFIDSEDPGIRQDTVTSEVSAFERKLGEVSESCMSLLHQRCYADVLLHLVGRKTRTICMYKKV